MDKITVILFTVPEASCAGNMSWKDVAGMLRENMSRLFLGKIDFKHIEFMSPEWFSHPDAQRLLETQTVNFPFVLADNEIVCAEPKVNISKIRKFVKEKLK